MPGGAVWLNGEFVERDAARVSAFDAGLQHGVGLFETMLAVDGRVFRLEAHMARISESARALGLSERLRGGALGEAVTACVRRAGLGRARVRATVTGGDLNLLTDRSGSGATDPTVLIDVREATAYPAAMFERGVSVVIADWRVNPLDPFEGHKTLRYWPRLRELQVAAGKQAAEAITLQVSNHVAGGCVSNVFLVRGGSLVTPIARGEEESVGAQLPSPVIPGITRSVVLEWAASRGIPVTRRMCGVGDLLDADEVFLTNSGWGVLPVVRVEAERVDSGEPGPMTRDARAHWLAATEEESGSTT
ncbi:MAG: aminotransferase class IV [Phycisphaeraceae bacterium]|nr:aminotransferase class IV [Phycisphaeraceae bacterium]MCB9847144.1 aminotransferase class IV [Phycisphaeraceae bacterium]